MKNVTKKPEILSKINFKDSENFSKRHVGPRAKEIQEMLNVLDIKSLEELVSKTVPTSILQKKELKLDESFSEAKTLEHLRSIANQNQVYRSLIGMGYSDTLTPSVILRNILENPGWYTQYTPYQAEIAQGRLEALLNFQTLTVDLTGLPIANASLLDEATACAEAMTMSHALKADRNIFEVSENLHPQNKAVIETRAEPLGIKIKYFKDAEFSPSRESFGAIFQYPNTWGEVDPQIEAKVKQARELGLLVTLVADPLALVLLKSPGAIGADIAVGSFQRFGVPMGFGGPHAAYMSCKEEFKRNIPGRIVGLSKDQFGNPAVRLALQTREQHIRREKATSNICTSQVLLAIMASMYAVYHGSEGLIEIAKRIQGFAQVLAKVLQKLNFQNLPTAFFDTVAFTCKTKQEAEGLCARFEKKRMNIRLGVEGRLSISLDEKTTLEELSAIVAILSDEKITANEVEAIASEVSEITLPQQLIRTDSFLEHPVFNQYHSEHEMLRYISRLERKDLSLNFSMIPLGSCTMKLNAATEMIPVTWPEFGGIHPAAPVNQFKGYSLLFSELESALKEITGFDAISLQPNAGSQGEYAGLLTIRAYHQSRGEKRNVCLIPKSAHGTNPASAAMAGMQVVVVNCDADGNVDVEDLKRLAAEHSKSLSCLMVTYPSTHGVFETQIKTICEIIHGHGGQVYMDGANMNAQIALCKPGEFGPDVCHLNLHKTFCIPHGGGGPGMGPIGVKKHLADFLPGHVLNKTGGAKSIGPVSGAPWGSASILPISYAYIKMMGAKGLKQATEVAILNANYIAKKLNPFYPVLYKGEYGFVAHECIIDLRPLKAETGIEVEDVAKRLMDYGFHAPTVSFPVAGTMMIEPTESESLAELDRFIAAMISIKKEIDEVKDGTADRKNNVLKNAPHALAQVAATEWAYPYSREKAVFPLPFVRDRKFWPSVGRIDNVAGDRNLICSCPPIDSYR